MYMQQFTAFLHFIKTIQLEFSVTMDTLTTIPPSFTVSLNMSKFLVSIFLTEERTELTLSNFSFNCSKTTALKNCP